MPHRYEVTIDRHGQKQKHVLKLDTENLVQAIAQIGIKMDRVYPDKAYLILDTKKLND